MKNLLPVNQDYQSFKGLAVLTCLFVLSFNLNAASNPIVLTNEQINHLGIQMAGIKPASNIPLLTAPAKVVVPPAHEQIVSAPQAGLVSQLNFAVGDSVKKGEIVAQINSPDIVTLQQRYLQVENQRQLALANYQRDKNLFAEGVIAQKRWQEARSQYAILESEAKSARQLLQIAGMSEAQLRNLTQTERFSSQLTLYAPLTGVVLEKMVVAGERLNSLSPLYKVANLDELWLEIAVAQEQIGAVHVGDNVTIVNTPISARIALLGKSINLSNQTVTVRAVINQRQPAVRAGQTVMIQLIQANDQTAFAVPSTALAQNEGKSYLFIHDPRGFKVQAVTMMAKQGAEVVISGALTGKEQIAANGAVALKALWLGLGEGD
jgi:cobalt-zinc-cadmium efflux system membrane fusion protein